MGKIRISGLVRLMRWAHEQLAVGILPGQTGYFRRVINQSLEQVERALQESQASPSGLPRPSLNAYRFLKGIDLQHLPAHQPAAVRRTNTPIGLCQKIQDRMSASLPALNGPGRGQLIDELHQEIVRGHAGAIGCLKASSGAPTRRAAAWLELLSERDLLIQHLDALTRILQLAGRAFHPGRPFRVEFFHTANLYRVSAGTGEIVLTAHEGFIKAPDEVLEALAGLAVSRRTRRRLQLVRTYAAGPDFLQLSRRLALLEPHSDIKAPGTHFYQLDQAFERVNSAYFSGALPQPRLAWSRRITYREFGHYQPSSDTVSISQSLDSDQVPEFVLDYVVFHELLHKQLGIKTAAGRLYSHTPAFHQAEKRFPRCAEAKACLQELARRLSPRLQQASRRRYRA